MRRYAVSCFFFCALGLIKCYISVPTIVLQVFLNEGAFKSFMIHIRHVFCSSTENTKCGLKPKYCVSPLAMLWGGCGHTQTSGKAMGSLCSSHPHPGAVGGFSCSSYFSSFPRGKQPVDPGTRDLTHPISHGWSYSISMEYSSVTCSLHKLPSPAVLFRRHRASPILQRWGRIVPSLY